MRKTKILIRLCGCTNCFEFSLCAHANPCLLLKRCKLKAAYSVTFDLLFFEIMFLFFKNTVKN